MRKLVFATHNAHKLREVQDLLAGKYELLSLTDIGCHDEIPETADTLEGNALIKARFVQEHYGYDVFADDTGLEVDALGGAPGVFSARYAGPQKRSEDNIEKLLSELEGKSNRKARFRTSIALILENEEWLFDGIVEGQITTEPSGLGGFGYDPVFHPEGYSMTFAEMSSENKNQISHRGRAVRKLVEFLNARKKSLEKRDEHR
ncbi:MAG: non-canonical purine NTP diphosphatase [Cryomorphaceae bacterium]|nr:MAG: non-canonical purine NTP diphosphatase [Cryomorphaceae bacterium]